MYGVHTTWYILAPALRGTQEFQSLQKGCYFRLETMILTDFNSFLVKETPVGLCAAVAVPYSIIRLTCLKMIHVTPA